MRHSLYATFNLNLIIVQFVKNMYKEMNERVQQENGSFLRMLIICVDTGGFCLIVNGVQSRQARCARLCLSVAWCPCVQGTIIIIFGGSERKRCILVSVPKLISKNH